MCSPRKTNQLEYVDQRRGAIPYRIDRRDRHKARHKVTIFHRKGKSSTESTDCCLASPRSFSATADDFS